MGDKRNEKSKNKTIYFVILFLIIILQLGRIIYGFVFLKEDFHSDEMWSFGLSNSYYEPFIYQNADHTEYINYKTWFSSEKMRDYLTVDKTHRFSYDSVYYNQVHDYHPPFYYFILHTICSFFPGKFSPWFSFAINIFSFIGTAFFLYKLIYEISGSEKIALAGCAFYGFSMGAFNTFEFVRIYALATMISTMYLYYHAKLYHSDKMKKEMIIIFIVSLIGCMTHHFFVPFAGCISVCFCIYYLLKGKYKKCLTYSFTMIGSVAASVLLFPATISHAFSDQIQDAKYPFIWQFRLTLNCMLKELFGFSVSVMNTHSYIVDLIVAVCISVLIIPLLFLFRKEMWFQKGLSFLKEFVLKALNKIKHFDLMVVSVLVSVFGIILLTAITVSYIYMEKQTDRYIFIVFPGAVAAFVVILNYLLKYIKIQVIANVILASVCAILCVMSNLYGPDNYIFTKDEGATSVQEIIKDSDCVFISDDFWLLTCFTRLSMEADCLYALTGEELEKDIADISDPPFDDRKLYYFVDTNSLYIEYETESMKWPERGMGKDQSKKLTQNQFESKLYEKYSMCDRVGFDNVFNREFLIYRVK